MISFRAHCAFPFGGELPGTITMTPQTQNRKINIDETSFSHARWKNAELCQFKFQMIIYFLAGGRMGRQASGRRAGRRAKVRFQSIPKPLVKWYAYPKSKSRSFKCALYLWKTTPEAIIGALVMRLQTAIVERIPGLMPIK